VRVLPFGAAAWGLLVLWGAVSVVLVSATYVRVAHRDLLGAEEDGAPAVTATATPMPTPAPAKPPGVFEDAALVTESRAFGELSAVPGDDEPLRYFYALTCRDGLLTVATTREVVFAEVECERYWLPDDVTRPFLKQPVRVRILPGTPGTLVVEALAAGAARLVTGDVWIAVREHPGLVVR
jgi:hypothetical protein